VILGFAGLVLAIWVLPVLLTRHLPTGQVAAIRLAAENDIRTPLVAALAVLGAAMITALYSERTTKLTLQAQALDRYREEIVLQGQITDRYTKAIDQLGSETVEVRIGGIYALERIGKDSVRDQPVVMEVLAAYIRQHSRERWPMGEAGADIPEQTRPDVQAAITVIGRRDVVYDSGVIDLTGANLPRAELNGADLSGVNLTAASLFAARLAMARLTAATLKDAILGAADLTSADLTGADLTGADLTGADLSNANLTGANLRDVNLTNANLTGVIGADL
jgi:hypothetical protein